MSALDQMKNLISSMIRPLRNRVYTMITRAIIETVDDSKKMQVVKLNLLAGESRDEVERFQNFGFSSNPPDKAECVALAIGGNRDHLIVVVADDRSSRIKGIAKGESVQYNSNGNKLHLKANGNYEGSISKLKFQNGTAEFVDLLVQTLAVLEAEPMIVNKALITAIKTQLTTFKVT